MLGVSTSTLRSWERRLGYPQPARTPGNHRLYELDEVEALRDGAARDPQHLQRGRGRPRRAAAAPPPRPAWSPPSTASTRRCRPRARAEPRGALGRAHRLRAAPARPRARRAAAQRRTPSSSTRAAGRPAGCTAPAAWRPARPATRASCCSTRARPWASRPSTTQALELFLRRAGLRVLLLSAGLAEGSLPQRPARARPRGGRDLRLRGAARRARRPAAAASHGGGAAPRLYGYRAARLVAGRDGVPSLGEEPGEATRGLLGEL